MAEEIRENWARSYKIVVGAPAYEESKFHIDYTSILVTGLAPIIDGKFPKMEEDSTTIPSNARILSNLTSEGQNQRGFTFTLDSTRLMSGGDNNSTTEKTSLKLRNLDADMIEVINQPNAVVRVFAGYGDRVTLAYSGDISSVVVVNEGSDRVYDISCVDGLGSIKNTIATIDYDESVSVADMIIDMANKFPDGALGLSGLSHLSETYVTGGMSFMGSLASSFAKITKANNLSCGRFNGKIVLSPYLEGYGTEAYKEQAKNGFNLTADVIKEITPISDNGSITSSDKKDKVGISVNTFYIPIELGQYFTIPKDTGSPYGGTYKVSRVRTKLESKGQAWDVVITGDPI